MVDLQTISIMIAAASVVMAATYYTLTLRKAERMRETTLETRQTQLFMQIYDRFQDPEFTRLFNEIQGWEWRDYDDYQDKYGSENMEASTAWWSVGKVFEGIGVLVKRGLIDVSLVDDLMSGQVLQYWEKVEPICREDRRRLDYPQAWEHVEYLYDQILPLVEEQHPELKT